MNNGVLIGMWVVGLLVCAWLFHFSLSDFFNLPSRSSEIAAKPYRPPARAYFGISMIMVVMFTLMFLTARNR